MESQSGPSLEEMGLSESDMTMAEKNPEKPTNVEEKRLNENDLIIADDDVAKVQQILEERGIRMKVGGEPFLNRVQVNESSYIPGSYVISIYELNGQTEQPASREYTAQVFDLIKSLDIPVQFGQGTSKG